MKRTTTFKALLGTVALSALLTLPAFGRDVEYKSGEISVRVNPGEPTEVQFPGAISGGFKRKLSSLSIDKKDSDLIVFASEAISESGEAIIVRLTDGRSYSLRVQRASPESPRDDVVKVSDERGALLAASSEEEPIYSEKKLSYAPPSQVSGLVREMVLLAEFGKQQVPGYRMSEQYRGEVVINDGTMKATIDKIVMGPALWGYVIDAENLLDVPQTINPASFRLDGTRAVSMQTLELAGRPLTAEQQLAGKHKVKVYIVTKAKKVN